MLLPLFAKTLATFREKRQHFFRKVLALFSRSGRAFSGLRRASGERTGGFFRVLPCFQAERVIIFS
jgi:hypothetical protein